MVLPHISRYLYPMAPPHFFHSGSSPSSTENSVLSLSSTYRLCFSQPKSHQSTFLSILKINFQLSCSSRLLLFLIAIFFFTTTNMKTIPYFMSLLAPCTWELLILLFTLLALCNKNICVSIYAKRKGEETEGDNIDPKVSSLGDQVISKSSTSA